MQETRVLLVITRIPHAAAQVSPRCHNYWACAPGLRSHIYWNPPIQSPCSTTREATAMRSPHNTTRVEPPLATTREKSVQQQRPGTPKNKWKFLKRKKYYPRIPEVAQSWPTLCDPIDCSLPGSSVHGIFQAIVLEWIAISFSRDLPNPGLEPRSPTL